MGDSWEDSVDDEYLPPPPSLGRQVTQPPPTRSAAPASWEDEEDQVDQDIKQPVKSQASAAVTQARLAKEQREEEALLNKIKYAGFESETAEQKKLRERRQIEDADEHLLMEMVGDGSAGSPRSTSSSGGVGGLAGLSVKTKDEHVAFALLVAKKMEVS
jgi:hypothetical protein